MSPVSEEGFMKIASNLVCNGSRELTEREFKAFFGKNAATVALIWATFVQPAKSKPVHLLWALMYMKLYNSWDVMSIMAGASKPTFMKWVWAWVQSMANECANLVQWEKRNRNV